MKNDWRTQLREFDPGLEAIEPQRAEQIRRAVLDAARLPVRQQSAWPWRLALASLALVLAASGAGDDVRRVSPMSTIAPAVDPPSGERRKVQFSTPGGTRIIWEINPEFKLTETLP